MAPNKVGDNSSVEVSEEVLRRGGSVVGSVILGRGGTGAKRARPDPPPNAVEGVPVVTCRV
ncbi:UNVERIFIED_CONTAM: hypothetical protein Slati_1445000 [Sesamum latifolium]|uniref:Uncharacterized protein n=1 Tax=Sesamum latifolium TaxID=2727402 RepID=A0AAW2X9N4_9LAMI